MNLIRTTKVVGNQWNAESLKKKIFLIPAVANADGKNTATFMERAMDNTGYPLTTLPDPRDARIQDLERELDAVTRAFNAEERESHLAKAQLPSVGATLTPWAPEYAERLRLAMLFIEEWSNWWSYSLGVDDDAPMPQAEKDAALVKAESLGARARDMVIDNRRFLAQPSHAVTTDETMGKILAGAEFDLDKGVETASYALSSTGTPWPLDTLIGYGLDDLFKMYGIDFPKTHSDLRRMLSIIEKRVSAPVSAMGEKKDG